MAVVNVPANPRSYYLLVVGSLGFLAAAVWRLVLSEAALSGVEGALALVSVLLFGAGCVWGWQRVRQNRAALVLDEEGLVDQATALAVGRVLWGQVAQVALFTHEKQHFVCVYLRQLPAVSATSLKGWLQRMALEKNQAMVGGAALLIPVGILALPAQEVIERMEHFRQAYEEKIRIFST